QCAKEGVTFEVFLLRLVESEMMDRERRATERRIKAAKFPVRKSLETYNFLDMPTLNKKLVIDLARCEWIGRRKNVLALGKFRDLQDSHQPGAGTGGLPARFSGAVYDRGGAGA